MSDQNRELKFEMNQGKKQSEIKQGKKRQFNSATQNYGNCAEISLCNIQDRGKSYKRIKSIHGPSFSTVKLYDVRNVCY